jgi:hypothetical protein
MSLQQHPLAFLVNYNGPNFPSGIVELLKTLESTDRATLDLAVEGLRGFSIMPITVTSDSYSWSRAYHFQRGRREVVLLLPGCQDSENKDGCSSDRSAAVYVKGRGAQKEVDSVILIIRQLLGAMHAQEDRQV